ncbi:MAG: transcriptional regulator [Candidatus Marinimicrobia bacterium]|nr:transcriptional regulator [Candidatus Neomarinimicrobiota bacterium]
MTQYDYHAIDDLIHSRIRLSILALLVTRIKASFTEIKNQVGASDGNLSIHIRKLEQAEYVSVNKKFINRKPLSMYTITDKGRSAFNHYIEHIESLLKIGELQ